MASLILSTSLRSSIRIDSPLRDWLLLLVHLTQGGGLKSEEKPEDSGGCVLQMTADNHLHSCL